MARNGISAQRYRFSVPDKDEDVIAWVNEQSDLSMSLRMLVKNFVAKEGIVDIMCRSRVKKNDALPKAPAAPSGAGKVLRETPVRPAVQETPQAVPEKKGSTEQVFVDPGSFFN